MRLRDTRRESLSGVRSQSNTRPIDDEPEDSFHDCGGRRQMGKNPRLSKGHRPSILHSPMKRLSLLILALTVVTAQPIAQTQSGTPDQPAQKSAGSLAPVRTML